MIGLLEGIVHEVTENTITLVAQGIGFEIAVPHAAEYALHEKACVLIHTHWNQEQGPSLFGFPSPADKKMFSLLLDCQGVGPKLALTIMQTLGTASIIDAFMQKNKIVLSSVSGIGNKKAELMILTLHEKITLLVNNGSLAAAQQPDQLHDIAQALKSLHYKKHEINAALEQLRPLLSDSQLSFDHLLRKALHIVSQK